MSQIEVWGTGKPLEGFTEDDVLTNARKVFPTTNAQHIARFIARKRFVITRVNDAAGAQRLIEGLAKSGIEADSASPPATVAPGGMSEPCAEATVADEQEATFVDEADTSTPPSARTGVREILTGHGRLVAAVAGLLIVIAATVVTVQNWRAHSRELAAQAQAAAKTEAELAAQRHADADARKRAEEAVAEKAAAAARDAARLEQKQAAFSEVSNAFAASNYPAVIALSERFDLLYGPDARVEELQQEATFTLKENARRGDFAAILDAPVKGSVRFAELRQWALEAQERAKAR